MSTSTPYRNAPLTTSTTAKTSASSTLSSLLAQANSLNNAERDPELPQIRLGIDEIERMSEAVAGRGKRGKSTRGEGYVEQRILFSSSSLFYQYFQAIQALYCILS